MDDDVELKGNNLSGGQLRGYLNDKQQMQLISVQDTWSNSFENKSYLLAWDGVEITALFLTCLAKHACFFSLVLWALIDAQQILQCGFVFSLFSSSNQLLKVFVRQAVHYEKFYCIDSIYPYLTLTDYDRFLTE